ncbi:hypothetical protein [Nocardioides sp. CER19]|uniref:hypothetical protein n=1 Tax=Nocardioides sp. CER19 TaxID=3038538 RepID=UPI0024480A84|nr:hypothetical protein [Nocardioides sp. CER19]MDH2416878.1 hypothetical protein [Nocardioides sp. CER19]
MLPRVSGCVVAAAVLALATACSSSSADEQDAPPPSPSPSIVGADGGPVRPAEGTGTLGPGFVTPTAPPPPGGTMTPSPDSWSSVQVPDGYTAALLSTDDSPAARHLATAVKAWAAAHHVGLALVPAHDPGSYVAAIQKAIDLHPDLVISAGDALADPLALVTASWTQQKFLLLGAELAEPTYNVTAAVWKGTAARGGGSGSARADVSTFTVERARRALDAGVAAVLRGYAGYVVQVD